MQRCLKLSLYRLKMELGTIFKCLDKIGSEGFKSSQSILDITNLIQDKLVVAHKKSGGEIFHKKLIYFDEFSKGFETPMQDERFKCAVNLLYLLYCTSYLCNEDSISGQESPSVTEAPSDKKKNVPEAPSNLLSVKHLKNIELCVEFLLYTVYCASLDEEAVAYLKLKIIRDKLVFGNCLEISPEFKHKSLKLILKYTLPLVKNESMGKHLIAKFLPEILCGLLQLCFSPSEIRSFPEDVEASREELEILLGAVLPLHMLKAILLLKGAAAQRKGKSWLKSVCQSIFIRRFLLKEGGVLLTIEAALSLGDFGDWRKKEAVAALVSSAKAPDEFEFFEKVCSQIISLIKEEKKGDILQLLSFMVLHLSKRSPKLTETYFFGPFLEPLVNFTLKGSISSATGKGLVQLISTLYKIFVEILPPGEMTSFLSPVVCPLALIAALPPTCHVKTDAQLTLVRYLSQLENKDLVCSILTIAGIESSSSTPPVNPELKLISRLNEIEIEYDAVQQNMIDCDERNVKSLVEIIDKLKIRSIVVELLQRLSVYLDFTVLNDFEVSSTQLLTEYDVNDIKFAKIRKLNIAVTLLNSICENENLTTDLFRDLGSAVPIIDALLKTHNQKPTDAGLAQTKEAFLMNCVMLVFCYVNDKFASGKMTSSDWKELRILKPSLQALEKSRMQSLSGLAEQLTQMILTHGTIGILSQEGDASENNASSRSRVLSCNSNACDGVSGPHTNAPLKHLPDMDKSHQSPSKDSCKVLSAYQEALVDGCSPLLPIRGHALISLAKLIQIKDKEAMKNSERILSLFEHHLRDEDSYIYLASIKGIAALSSHFPQKVVTTLTEEFSRSSQTIETRLKLIEVLTETSRLLGPVLPKYKNLFLNCLLNGVRDEDFLVRASCLSNLGEVCKELKFSVEPVVHEIFSVLHNVVQFDKSPEVKRAGVLFVTLLLQGLGRDMIKVLQDVILDLYRSLKKILTIENDPILITQAELAIEEINSVTRDFLLPKLGLQKKIFITEVPSNPL